MARRITIFILKLKKIFNKRQTDPGNWIRHLEREAFYRERKKEYFIERKKVEKVEIFRIDKDRNTERINKRSIRSTVDNRERLI